MWELVRGVLTLDCVTSSDSPLSLATCSKWLCKHVLKSAISKKFSKILCGLEMRVVTKFGPVVGQIENFTIRNKIWYTFQTCDIRKL